MGRRLERVQKAHPEQQELDMERPLYLNSPRAKDRKPILSTSAKKLPTTLKILAIALLSPLWIPLLPLLLPVKFWHGIRDRKGKIKNPPLEDLQPKPGPRPIDPELERRREMARLTNKHSHPKIRILYDPIRDDPNYAWAIKEAGERAKEEAGHTFELGTCHLIWNRKKQILKEEFGIDWYSAREMNPNARFD
jgi:hypothetical protein